MAALVIMLQTEVDFGSRIGTTGGDAISITDQIPVLIKTLRSAFEHWLPAYMGSKAS